LLGGGGSQAHNQFWFEHTQFRVEPRSTRGHLACVWFRVQASLAARGPFKVFYCIRHIDHLAIDATFLEHAIEQSASRSNKGMSFAIFSISWLLANDDKFGVQWAFTENRLRGITVKLTTSATCGGTPE
jgi:hypothetical protein